MFGPIASIRLGIFVHWISQIMQEEGLQHFVRAGNNFIGSGFDIRDH
jgi:hypothetical protein